MSRSAGLQKLSVEYLRVYHFKCTSAELSDYLVKLEIDPMTAEHCFSVYYGVLRANRLFLFSHTASQQCKTVVNLEHCIVRDVHLDKQWPACCTSGCQIWLPGCYSGGSSTVPADAPGCWQLGFFSGSKWKRHLDVYSKQAGSSEPADATDSEYDNDEYDAGDTELSGLWAMLADTDPRPVSPQPNASRAAPGQRETFSGGSATPQQQPLASRPFAVGRASGASVQPPPPIRTTPDRPALAPPTQTLLDTPVPPLQQQLPSGQPVLSVDPSFPQLRPVQQQQQQQPVTMTRSTTQQLPPPPPPPKPAVDSHLKSSALKPAQQTPPPPPPPPPQNFRNAGANAKQLPQPPLPLKTPLTPEPPQTPQSPQTSEAQQPLPPPIPPRDGRGLIDQVPGALQQPPPQTPQAAPADLYDLMSQGLCVDALCSYFCRGYYCSKDLRLAKQLMRLSSDNGVYMLRGFCNRQAGQDKTLCVKYSMVYKFRVRVLQQGYQIWNEHNNQVHNSMEALLFYHHLFPIRVAQKIQHELLLRRPFDLELQRPDFNSCNLMLPLSSALWSHGSKEMCAEILRNSDDGTYTLRYEPSNGGAVLCITHRSQILKFRVVMTMTDSKREFSFHHLPASPKFASLEELIIHYHNNPIRGSTADGEILLKVPFQLVPRCQQELDFQHISLDASIFTTGSVASVSNKVARMSSGNFLVLRRSQQKKQQQQQELSEDSDATTESAAATIEHTLIVRDDNGSVRTFRITERDTDLSFRPQKTFTLEDRPELVTDRIEKMVHLLCIKSRFLSPEITSLVKP